MDHTRSLPLDPHWPSTTEYVDSLLSFVTSSDLFQNLCGGVHLLDFLTREPDLYTHVLPGEWRDWFELVDIDNILDLLLREDLGQLQLSQTNDLNTAKVETWRGFPTPPSSLVSYIHAIRIHSLVRSFEPVSSDISPLPRHVAAGMKVKKAHEVENFAAYVDQLSTSISKNSPNNPPISIIDFGSGQNYLGRTLASSPYEKHVIAIERYHHNVTGAKNMDVHAKLAKKEISMTNKKEYRRRLKAGMTNGESATPPASLSELEKTLDSMSTMTVPESVPEIVLADHEERGLVYDPTKGSMTYIEHELSSGHLEQVLHPSDQKPSLSSAMDTENPSPETFHTEPRPKSIVVSIHSCGNLTHHGLRSITLNPSIKAVAMIGCCYNLLTERLGPTTYNHPRFRSNHPRLKATSSSCDPHGFPMSSKLENYTYSVRSDADDNPSLTKSNESNDNCATIHDQPIMEKGVRLNITARMMAVQAPSNWGPIDSEAFFRRHFYRALLQKILLDRNVVKQASSSSEIDFAGGSLSGKDAHGTPLIIGTLGKSAFVNFRAYVTAALHKLWKDKDHGGDYVRSLTSDLIDGGTSDGNGGSSDEIKYYEDTFGYKMKHLSVIWSLMAFSAGVVESLIVVDRWLWLCEQSEVETAWVDVVFDYKHSPRNLVVVGIKKD